MQAGKLRHSVIVQQPGGTIDSFGERTTTWANVLTTRAYIRPLSMRERVLADQVQSTLTHVVKLRWCSAIAAIASDWRLLYGSRVLTIISVINYDEANNMLELMCEEGAKSE